jgi:hypothetical protein
MPGWVLVHGLSEVPMSDEVARLLRDGLDTSETGRDLIVRIRSLAKRGETRIELSDDDTELVVNVLGLKLHPSLTPAVRDEINRIRNSL